MFLVGLTGGIASGKSTVSSMFRNLDCEIIDADQVAREVVEPGRPAWKEIIGHFGKDILLPNGEIDRDKLGKIIFADPKKRRLLNNCTHPAIHKSMLWKVIKMFFKGHRFVIMDIPLLFESGMVAPFMNKIAVVWCNPDVQLRRLIERNCYTKKHAQERISVQMALNEKCQWATYVIDNSNTEEETMEQVVKIYEELKTSRTYIYIRIVAGVVACGILALGYMIVAWLWQKIYIS